MPQTHLYTHQTHINPHFCIWGRKMRDIVKQTTWPNTRDHFFLSMLHDAVFDKYIRYRYVLTHSARQESRQHFTRIRINCDKMLFFTLSGQNNHFFYDVWVDLDSCLSKIHALSPIYDLYGHINVINKIK